MVMTRATKKPKKIIIIKEDEELMQKAVNYYMQNAGEDEKYEKW